MITKHRLEESQKISRLLLWLSPALPIGSFAYSRGLEWLASTSAISSISDIETWLDSTFLTGSGWNDLVACSNAYDCASDAASLQAVNELALSLCSGKERYLEATQQGKAFVNAVREWMPQFLTGWKSDACFSVCVGAASYQIGLPREVILDCFLNSMISNCLQAAQRLGILGQQDALKLLSAFETKSSKLIIKAQDTCLDAAGTMSVISDLASLQHETQRSRIFVT